jgi:hypothetical protein
MLIWTLVCALNGRPIEASPSRPHTYLTESGCRDVGRLRERHAWEASRFHIPMPVECICTSRNERNSKWESLSSAEGPEAGK